jgi:WD40 repeat protein
MLADRELQANRVGQAEKFLAGCSERERDWEWHYLKRLCHTELLTLRGHTRPVTGVAWNEQEDSSQSRIASAGRDKTIRIWDGRNGREILKISENDQAIAAVAFSPDGRQLLSASLVERGQKGHGRFTLWNAHNGKKIWDLPEPTGTTPLASFTPDGKLLATCSGVLNNQQHVVKFWQLSTGQEMFRLNLGAPASALAFSADSRALATGDAVGELTVWDLATRKAVEQVVLGRERDMGLRVAFSPNGRQLAAGGSGGLLWLLDREAPRQRLRLQGHTEDVRDLAFSPNGSWLASASWDRTVKLWSTATGNNAQTLRGHTEAIYSLAFNADGTRLVTASEDATLKIWDLLDRPEETKLEDSGLIIRVAFNNDGTRLTAADTFGKVRVWDLSKRQELCRWEDRQNTISDAAITADGTLVAYATDTQGKDGEVKVCNVATRQVLRTLRGHKGPVYGVAFGPDGSVLASTGMDRRAILWKVADGTPLHTYEHADGLGKLAFSPDGKFLAVTTAGGTILWDTATHRERFISGHKGGVSSVCFSPMGDLLASGGKDRTVRLWDLKSDALVHVFPNHGDGVMGLSFHRCGKRLAVAAGSFLGAAEVKIYDLTEGQEVLALRRPKTVLDVAFSPQGDRLAAAWASHKSEITLWDGTPWNNAAK